MLFWFFFGTKSFKIIALNLLKFYVVVVKARLSIPFWFVHWNEIFQYWFIMAYHFRNTFNIKGKTWHICILVRICISTNIYQNGSKWSICQNLGWGGFPSYFYIGIRNSGHSKRNRTELTNMSKRPSFSFFFFLNDLGQQK